MTKRIIPDQCLGAIIDVQEFFLAQLDESLRAAVETSIGNLARLLGYFKIPLLVTLERPLDHKGSLPRAIGAQLNDLAHIYEKDFFDLIKERKIRDCLRGLQKKQVIIAGCETDVCVLQSCLGFLDLGYEVFVVEDLIFSSARNVDAAIARMQAAGAVFLTYKTLYYELIQAVDGGRHGAAMRAAFGPFPDDLPDQAVE